MSINNEVLACLELIPTHHQSVASVDEIARRLSKNLGIDQNISTAYVNTLVTFLRLFDALHMEGDGIKLRNQITTYFKDSIYWYVANNHTLVSNWDRLGTSRDLYITHLLDAAPYFFRIMEERRIAISVGGPPPTSAREQKCSVVFIKGDIDGEICFLHQWDQDAERFQLIGGKCRPNESFIETARREFQEEIADHSLVFGRDYILNKIVDSPIKDLNISRTYGALTTYEISPFVAIINKKPFALSAADRWISIEEIRRGVTSDGRHIAPFFTLMEATLPNFVEQIPFSIAVKNTRSLMDYTDIKPGFWFIKFDLKKWLREKMKNDRK